MIGLALGACVVGIALVIERRDSPRDASYFVGGVLVGSFCVILLEAVL